MNWQTLYYLVRRCKNSGIVLSVMMLIILLTACLPLTTNRGQQMENLVEVSNLEVPEGTTLVTQIEKVDQGSDERCQFLHVERLYGTKQPFEQIRLFYEQLLTAKDWQKDVVFSDVTYIGFERSDGFILGINDHETASFISRRQIQDARQKFETVYLVEAVYASPKTWERCGQQVENNR